MSGGWRCLRYGRDGRRLGTLRACGAAVHREELGGEDVLELTCLEAPGKYERLVWRDPEDGRWREHVVVRTDERAGGGCEVCCEGSLCDLLAGVVVDTRLSGATAAEAASAVLGGAGWESSAEGLPGVTGSCLIYHANRLAALRRVCEIWGAEPDPYVEVGPSGVTARGVVLRARVGAWRGARLTYGRSMAGCVRTVAEDEVFTALYGWGAGEAVMGEDGSWTGGYRKRIDFSSVNSGEKWVGDEEARLAWGIALPDGSRAHRFGQVVFDGVTDPEQLLELTQAALARGARRGSHTSSTRRRSLAACRSCSGTRWSWPTPSPRPRASRGCAWWRASGRSATGSSRAIRSAACRRGPTPP
ncbi:phage tail spike protein [Collinsella ihumii]|uniref:phage tail spike protein n=1 Tax=Collinsella ihumii TaxID=1720204 RepID=UPI0025AB0330|nr:phage tail spike protein [Collinsella ihumii]MDN0056361.1 phage tail spike protein [Collinsella ihumii]